MNLGPEVIEHKSSFANIYLLTGILFTGEDCGVCSEDGKLLGKDLT